MPKLLSLFSIGKDNTTIMVSQKLAKKILNAYYDLRFPGSFGGIPVFRKSLQKNRGITISHWALQRLLKSSLHYQINVTKAKRFKTRPFYSQGVGIEGFTDTAFIGLKLDGQNSWSEDSFFSWSWMSTLECYLLPK